MTNQSNPAWKAGDTCYDECGNEFYLRAVIPTTGTDSYVVSSVIVHDDGEFMGEPEILQRIFRSPPIQRRSEEIERLDALIGEKKKTLQELTDKVRAEQRAFDDSMARLKDCAELVNIDRFLAGEITHFVFYTDHDAQVRTFEQAIVTSESRETAYRLLSLFGDAKRKVKWGIASYSDGSGSTRWNVIPCCSFEEAKAKAIELHTAALKKIDRAHAYQVTNWIKHAGILGIPVPEDLAKAGHEISVKSAKSNLDCRQKNLEEATRYFNEAQKTLAELTVEVLS